MSTFLRPQALLALVVGLAACGQERPTEPLAAFARATGDTLGVLRAVAAVIAPLQARHDSARASSNDLAPNYLERCPRAFGALEAFEVIRSDGAWVARITEVGMT